MYFPPIFCLLNTKKLVKFIISFLHIFFKLFNMSFILQLYYKNYKSNPAIVSLKILQLLDIFSWSFSLNGNSRSSLTPFDVIIAGTPTYMSFSLYSTISLFESVNLVKISQIRNVLEDY